MNGAGGTTYHENYFAVTTPVRRRGIHRWISGVTGAILQGNFFLFFSSSLPYLPDHVNKAAKGKPGDLYFSFAVGSSHVSWFSPGFWGWGSSPDYGHTKWPPGSCLFDDKICCDLLFSSWVGVDERKAAEEFNWPAYSDVKTWVNIFEVLSVCVGMLHKQVSMALDMPMSCALYALRSSLFNLCTVEFS